MKTITIAIAIGSALVSVLSVTTPAFQSALPLVFENSGRATFSDKDGIIELRAGPGRLRSTTPFADFRLTLEFRLVAPDTEAAILLRGWLKEGDILDPNPYRITLPKPGSAVIPSALVGPAKDVKLTEAGGGMAGPAGEWQRLDVVADGAVLRVALNQTLAGVYEVEPLAGYVLFTAAKGAVQLRDIRIVSIDHPFPDGLMPADQIVKQRGTLPRPRREVKAVYASATARQQRLEGMVVMEIVVLKDGSVGPVRIIKSLHPDLDRNAVATIRRWRFHAATVAGAGVSTLAVIEMSYTLPKQ